MKFSTIATTTLTTLSALSGTEAAHCAPRNRVLATHYTITAQGVPNIPATCGGLWDNLKRWGICASASETYCGGSNGNLEWRFVVARGCNKGQIHSTWYEATKNRYGGINCP